MEWDQFTRSEIDGYRIGDILGRGGMGTVYRARSLADGSAVAFKILEIAGTGKEEIRRFRRESQLQATLTHPNLMRLLGSGAKDEYLYLVLELVKGESLDRYLQRHRPVSIPEGLRIGRGIAQGLAHLHANGITHRDIKPSNVMLDGQNRVLICDFGLSRNADVTLITKPGQVMGTPGYMAPELFNNLSESECIDNYALGVILYEVLAGCLPYAIEGNTGVVFQTVNATPKPPSQHNAGLSPELDALVLGLLEKDPARRTAAKEAASVLEQEGARDQSHQSRPLAPAPSQPQKPPASGRRYFPVALLALGVLSAAALHRRLVVDSLRTPTSSAATPAPATTVAAPPSPQPEFHERVRFLPSVKLVEPYAIRLARGGKDAKDATQSLSKLTGVDLAHPLAWLHWIQLGRWMEHDGQGPPPRLSQANSGPFDPLEEMAIVVQAKQVDAKSLTPARVGQLLRSIIWQPDDPRAWLALGWLLESRCGVLRRNLYHEGYTQLRSVSFMVTDPDIWVGLFRAEHLEGRGSRWTRNVLMTAGNRDTAFDDLQNAFSSNRLKYEQLLLSLADYPPFQKRILADLQKVMADQFNHGDWDDAISACTAALRLYPQNSRFHYWRAVINLNFGRVDEAREDSATSGEPSLLQELELMEDPRPGLNCDKIKGDAYTAWALVMRLLETGRFEAAAAKVKTAMDSRIWSETLSDRAVLMLLEAGVQAPWLTPVAERLLAKAEPLDTANYLSRADNPVWRDRFLGTDSLWTRPGGSEARNLCRQLIESRRGDPLAADAEFRSDLAQRKANTGWVETAEIMAHAIWKQCLQGVFKPLRHRPRPPAQGDALFGQLMEGLRYHDIEYAEPPALLFAHAHPGSQNVQLMALYLALAAGDAKGRDNILSHLRPLARTWGFGIGFLREIQNIATVPLPERR